MLKDYLISIMIVTVTLLYFYITYIVPKDLKAINVFGFEIGSFGFTNIWDLVYFSKMKFLILAFAIIWYLTCKHWWKHSILIIICIELFKIFSIFNVNSSTMDEIEYYSSLPITIPIIFLLIFLSRKFNSYNKYYNLILLIDNEINSEISELDKSKVNEIEKIKSVFLKIKSHKNSLSKKDYLKKMKQLRNQFYEEI